MSLNIKNERVHELARHAARLTGKSQTAVIEEALRLYVAELAEADAEVARQHRLDLIFAEIDATVTDEMRAAMQQVEDGLYDENGMPA
jgi:antitoxin VapB